MSTSSTTHAPLQNPSTIARGRSIANSNHPATHDFALKPYPLSPPLSASAAQFDASAPCSPQDHVFTPQSAPPMSAQTSHQGFTPPSYSPSKEINRGAFTQDTDVDAVMQEDVPEPPQRTSLKHRLSDDDEPTETEAKKRRRTDHDRMDIEDTSLDSTQAQSSFTPLYKIGTQPIPLSRPHATADLFNLYSLSSLASSVARNDPVTGAKINTLKKSYKGKLKDLAGKNRANPNPGELRGLLDYPDEEWHIQRVMGKELVKRDASGNVDITYDPAESLLAKLGTAVKMQPGELPRLEKEKWEDLLGLDEQPVVKAAPPKVMRPGVGIIPVASTSQPVNGLNNAGAVIPPRPKRQGTKRNYDDASFEGYRELAEDVGDTDGDDDGRSGKRKRRKSNPSSTAPSPHFTYATAGPAGVSVGSGTFGIR